MKKDFNFDLNAKKIKITDNDILGSLQKYAEISKNKAFTTSQYDKWADKICYSGTISKRFGSWRKALLKIGITEGVQEKQYDPTFLVENLMLVWQEIGYPPGKKMLPKYGHKISERPYINRWGSLRRACEAIANFQAGKITEAELLGNNKKTQERRKTIPLKTRWQVLKRDKYTCKKCGASPSKNSNVELEIDHIIPHSKGGKDNIDNLQTLCWQCNQGKKDKP